MFNSQLQLIGEKANQSNAENIEWFVINAFPKLKIIQLPNLAIDFILLINHISNHSAINYSFNHRISQEEISRMFTDLRFDHLIILKINDGYLYLNATMIEALEIFNQVHRMSKLKVFW